MEKQRYHLRISLDYNLLILKRSSIRLMEYAAKLEFPVSNKYHTILDSSPFSLVNEYRHFDISLLGFNRV